MFVRAIDDYEGRIKVGEIFEVVDYQSDALRVLGKLNYDYFSANQLIYVKAKGYSSYINRGGNRVFHEDTLAAYAWRFQLYESNNIDYSPEQCGDTEEDI
jgi:hypothetical protein